MAREKLIIKHGEELTPITEPLTRDHCYQNDLQGAKIPQVFGYRTDNQVSEPVQLAAVDRVIDYFHRLNDSYELGKFENDDMWGQKFTLNYSDFVAMLLRRDREELLRILREVCNTKLVNGFYENPQQTHWGQGNQLYIFDSLVSIACAFGHPVYNPEQGALSMAHADFEQLFEFVLEHIPALRYPPKAGGGIFGILTNLGVIAWRDLGAAFNATRVVENLGHLPRKVAEIGGGIGSLAYYLARMGVTTSVFDIPVVSLLQSYFLMISLGPERVWIDGEDANPSARAHVLPWWKFGEAAESGYSLVVNVDSLPEIELGVAVDYIQWIHAKSSDWFLSINQESAAVNFGWSEQNVVGDLVAMHGGFKRTYRFPSWLRPGYVEELYRILK